MRVKNRLADCANSLSSSGSVIVVCNSMKSSNI